MVRRRPGAERNLGHPATHRLPGFRKDSLRSEYRHRSEYAHLNPIVPYSVLRPSKLWQSLAIATMSDNASAHGYCHADTLAAFPGKTFTPAGPWHDGL